MKLAKIVLGGSVLRECFPFLKGYELVYMDWDRDRRVITFTITGEGLPEVLEGMIIPEGHVETGHEEHECDACGMMHRTSWSKLHP